MRRIVRRLNPRWLALALGVLLGSAIANMVP